MSCHCSYRSARHFYAAHCSLFRIRILIWFAVTCQPQYLADGRHGGRWSQWRLPGERGAQVSHLGHAGVRRPARGSGRVRAEGQPRRGLGCGAHRPKGRQAVRGKQGARVTEHAARLLALLPLGPAVLEPHLRTRAQPEQKRPVGGATTGSRAAAGPLLAGECYLAPKRSSEVDALGFCSNRHRQQ